MEVIWFLCTDDPARGLLFPEHGKPVNKDQFSFYGSTGDTVKTGVWPAVLSGDDGTLLQKGIVVPCVLDEG